MVSGYVFLVFFSWTLGHLDVFACLVCGSQPEVLHYRFRLFLVMHPLSVNRLKLLALC